MTKLAYEAIHAADVATVFPILTAAGFLEDCARQLGADTWTVAVTPGPPELTTQLDLRAPTRNIPATFRRFFGPHVNISEKRTWNAPAADGSRQGGLSAHALARGHEAFVTGTLLLAPAQDAARFTVDADVTVRLGLLSDLAAAKVGELLASVLNDQTIVLDRWLTTRGG